MSKKYDAEMFLDDLEALMIAHLNAKIAEINLEKSDGITLKSVDDNAYFLQELNGKQVNFNPFILYGIDPTSSNQSIRSGGAEDLVISVVIVVEDNAQDVEITTRMLRYRRCLTEVFQENYQFIQSSSILEVQSLLPQSFEALNSSDTFRVVGVNLKSSLAD